MTTTSPRITARVDTDTQELLVRAAAISGMPSINAFVLSAAVEKARTIMAREHALQLSERDAVALVAALDGPVNVHPRLHQAAERYESKAQE